MSNEVSIATLKQTAARCCQALNERRKRTSTAIGSARQPSVQLHLPNHADYFLRGTLYYAPACARTRPTSRKPDSFADSARSVPENLQRVRDSGLI